MIFKKNETINLNSILSKLFFDLTTIKDLDENMFVSNYEDNNIKYNYQYFNQLKEKTNKKFNNEISIRANNKYDNIQIDFQDYGSIYYEQLNSKIVFEGKLVSLNDKDTIDKLKIMELVSHITKFLNNLNNMIDGDLEFLKQKLLKRK